MQCFLFFIFFLHARPPVRFEHQGWMRTPEIKKSSLTSPSYLGSNLGKCLGSVQEDLGEIHFSLGNTSEGLLGFFLGCYLFS